MRKKIFKNVCGLTCILGLLLMFGTVGSMELDKLPLWQGVVQSIAGLAITVGAGYLGGFME